MALDQDLVDGGLEGELVDDGVVSPGQVVLALLQQGQKVDALANDDKATYRPLHVAHRVRIKSLPTHPSYTWGGPGYMRLYDLCS